MKRLCILLALCLLFVTVSPLAHAAPLEIKGKSGKRWDAVVAALIAGAVGAMIGHFLG